MRINSNVLMSALLAGSFFFTGATATAQTVFLSEDFATASGVTPPSGWTNNTIIGDLSFDKWQFSNPGGRILNSPITAPAGIFDGDYMSAAGGVEEVSLESPAFSTIGYAEIELKWNQYFQSGYGGTANVEVFDGSSWVNVYLNYSTTTDNPELRKIDISSVAGNRTGVKVRFRWTGNDSWYWIIDNIIVQEANHAPVFVNGGTQYASFCLGSGANDINNMLKVADEDAGQTLTWSVSTPAAHGTAVASYSVTSTGGTLTPTGITYAPDPGYTGPDVIAIQVTDGADVVNTTITVNVVPPPSITATTADEICSGATGHISATPGDNSLIRWYDMASGGSLLGSDTALTIPGATATISYYAEARANNSLTSTFAAGSGQSGAMFDMVIGSSDIDLERLNVFTFAGPGDFDVYYRAGTFVGHESDLAGWVLAGSFSGLSALTDTVRTFTLPSAITLNASQTYGFYVTGSVSGAMVKYTPGTVAVGSIYSSNADVAILLGDGVAAGMAGTYAQRMLNFSMTYETATPACSVPARNEVVLTVNPLPALTIGVTPEVCPRTSVASLTYTGLSNATAGVDKYTINWDVTAAGQGFIDVAATSIPTSPISLSVPLSAIPDTYIGALVLDNGQCQSDTITVNVTINPNPDTIAGPKVVCESAMITLTDASAGGSWSSADAGIAAIGTDGVVSGSAAGTAVISYTLPTSCFSRLVVTVNPLPQVYDVTGGGRFCAGGTGVAVGLSNSESGTTYDLYTGGMIVATEAGTAAAVDFGAQATGGVYTVHATSSEGCGNDMNGDITVTVVPLVTPSVSVTAAPGDTVCAGTSTTFTASPVNGGAVPVYEWQVNGVAVSSITDTHTFTPADADVVTVIMTSDEECPSPADATATQTMVVVSNETPTATIVSAPHRKVCDGTTVVFGATGTFGGSDPVYTWYKNTVSTGITGSTYSYVPTDGDVISAKLNSSYRCPIVNDVPSNNLTMEVDSVFVPVAVISTNTGLDIVEGTSVTFTANVTQAGSMPRYQWVLNSTAIPAATSATYTNATLANGDSVSCIVWGTGDCSYYTFNSVKVNVATGFMQTSVGTSDIRLMPNPNSGEFAVAGTIDVSENAQVGIEITNMLGQVVYSANATTVSGRLNERIQLSNDLASGMYMLNIHHSGSKTSLHFVLRK